MGEEVKPLVERLRKASRPRRIAKGFVTGPRAQSAILCEDGNAAADAITSLQEQLREHREALAQAEACMTIVEPRSDKAEYLRILGVMRAVLASTGEK